MSEERRCVECGSPITVSQGMWYCMDGGHAGLWMNPMPAFVPLEASAENIKRAAVEAGLDELGWDTFDWTTERWNAYQRFRALIEADDD